SLRWNTLSLLNLCTAHITVDMDDSTGESVSLSQLACSRCSKPAVLQCPKCVQLKLPRVNATF
ncbi:hypothetical protein L7F22_057714, partial [Adiantum nelumboides]|nr:hypothetical protein [Adiantum nelumboides]